MCDPLSAAIALSVATAAAGIVSQVKSAKTNEAAIRSTLLETNTQIDQKATGELNDRQRVARREQARVRVAAGEAGLQLGGSIDLLLMDSLVQSGLAAERTAQNRDNERSNATAEANSMLSRIQSPTILGAGLQLGTAALDGYATGSNLKVTRQTAKARAGSPQGS